MSKGLEALTELKFQVGNITYCTHDLRITTLKVRDSGLFEAIEKELKALEIIRNKKVNTNCIISGWALGKYNSYQSHINLTKKEFELLKEVLI